MTSYNRKYRSLACGLVAGLAASAALAGTAEAAGSTSFALARSTGLPPTCAPNAKASVKIQKQGFAEKLTLTVSGLPAGTELDLFTLQVPNVPFGLGWYVGDLEVGSKGTVSKSFVGRFSIETFALAVIRSAPAPATHPGDASVNPLFPPLHTYHLGIWFNSPGDAAKAGCATNTTPFNGEHKAGIQVLSSNGFGDLDGPLKKVK